MNAESRGGDSNKETVATVLLFEHSEANTNKQDMHTHTHRVKCNYMMYWVKVTDWWRRLYTEAIIHIFKFIEVISESSNSPAGCEMKILSVVSFGIS